MSPRSRSALLTILIWAGTQLIAGAQPTPIPPTVGVFYPSFAPTFSLPISSPTKPISRSLPIAGDLQRLYEGWQASPASYARAQRVQAIYPQLQLSPEASAVLVRVTGHNIDALLPALQMRGFVAQSVWPALHFVEGFLPVSELGADADGLLALVPKGLLGVRPCYRAAPNTGRVTSEADQILEAERVRRTQPGNYNGHGVRVGVMSDSFNALGGAASDIASGDLPANGVQILQDLASTTPGASDEGRAMCQLIYDLAPGAQQVFSSVLLGEGNFAAQIRRLANPGQGNCKVLVDDLRYFEEPFFQDGVIAQAINEVVTQRGVAYFSSAGNYGSQSYENDMPVFVPMGPQGNTQLNFAPSGTDLAQRFAIPHNGNVLLTLQWSDPFYTVAGVKTDLDAYLVSARGDTVALANDNNIGLQTPSEFLSFTNDTARTHTTTFDLSIVRFRGTADPARVKYVNAGSAQPTEWITNSGTIVGHAAAVQAQAVAAAGYYNQRTIQTYSSKGAPTILFSPTGTPLPTPEVRPKPDITAVDGVNNTFFGSANNDLEGDGFPNFFGTSAAAPHAAAVAALLRQAEADLTPAQVYERLRSTARDLGPTGFDNNSGAGLLNAYAALYGSAVSAPVPTVQGFDEGALSRFWLTNNDLAGRVQIRQDGGKAYLVLSAHTGQYFTQAFASPSEAIFYTSATGVAGDILLTFREKEFENETDDVLPTKFTGTRNGDGVALSVDGGLTWFRLVDLTGSASTITYQPFAINLTQFARTHGLALGDDVRIKFQQYGSGRPEAATPAQRGGIAFDDIALAQVLRSATTADVLGLHAWPNPVGSGVPFSLALPAQRGAATLTLVDALGRRVWQQEVQLTGQPLLRTVTAPLGKGLYTLLYQATNGSRATRRLLVE